MSQAVASREVTILNPQGLHARPADLFARLASRFGARIWLIKDEQRANGKSILDILMLAAEYGSRLTIEASGGDAEEAVEVLAGVLERASPTEAVAE
jgi:phosphotransferase system HPr (HPr) family protein